jgi:hypothetical protein
MESTEEIFPLSATYGSEDKSSAYKDALFRYGTEIISTICTRRSDQWELFAHIEPGIVLFSFSNHQRLAFTRRGDRLNYRFRRNKQNQRSFSFRCLWLIQSPVFQEAMTHACPLIDRGQVYLTHILETDTYHVRLSWGDAPFVPEGEVLIQSLVEYNFPKGLQDAPQDAPQDGPQEGIQDGPQEQT